MSIELIFYDVETTGLNVWKDKITELAATTQDDSEFNTLICIEDEVIRFYCKINGNYK